MSDSPADIWRLATTHIGRETHRYDLVDSTNTRALSFAEDPSRNGHVWLTREQTAGRGQYGRVWQAPPGSSVLMSVLLFPPPALRRPVLLTAWAAVSVCDTVETLTSLPARIKWPNDVLVHGKKVCGILIEQRTTSQPHFPLATVAGIGLNVSQSADLFTQAGLLEAASLASLTDARFTFEEVAHQLIHQLDARYNQLLTQDWASLEDSWRQRIDLIDQDVIVEGFHETQRGRLVALTFAGVEIAQPGVIKHIPPGSIKHLRRE